MHVNRKEGLQQGLLNGAHDGDMRKLGLWANDVMATVYKSVVPFEGMMSMAGFARNGEDYFLARALVDPPAILREMIFPFMEEAKEWYDLQPSKNATFEGVYDMLMELRVVLMQDSVLLKKSHPILRIWQHPIFEDPTYLVFEKQLNAVLASTAIQEPLNLQITKLVPALATQMLASNTKIGVVADCYLRMDNTISTLDTRLASIESMLGHMQRGFVIRTSNATVSNVIPASTADTGGNNTSVVLAPNLVDKPVPEIESNPEEFSIAKRELFDSAMLLRPSCVKDIWDEYTIGIPGNPSLMAIESNFSHKWRYNAILKTRYCRRMKFVSKIKDFIGQGATPDEAAEVISNQMKAQGLSIAKTLKKNPVTNKMYLEAFVYPFPSP